MPQFSIFQQTNYLTERNLVLQRTVVNQVQFYLKLHKELFLVISNTSEIKIEVMTPKATLLIEECSQKLA